MNPDPTRAEDPRNRLAGERTLLAWVRTSLAMMGFGFVVARFGIFLREIAAAGNVVRTAHTEFSLWIGITLVLLGVGVGLIAALEHFRFLKRLDRGLPYEPPHWPLSIIVAVAMSVVGVAMAIYLVLLRA